MSRIINHAQPCSIMVNHGQLWSNVVLSQRFFLYENIPWSITIATLWQILSHGPTLHCDNHGHPWPSIVNHGQTSHCDKDHLNIKINHGQPWLTMVQRGIVIKILSIWKKIVVNHGPTFHCDKDCLSMKINNVCFMVYNIYLRVYILWIYNINPFCLILFPCVSSINPLGLLVSWIYNIIDSLGSLIPWVYVIFLCWFLVSTNPKFYNINPLGLYY